MTPRERAYILRIAAIREVGEWGEENLVKQLRLINPAWDERAIAAAVAHVRTAIQTIPFTTIRMEIAA